MHGSLFLLIFIDFLNGGVSYMGLSGTLGPIMITMKTTHGLSGTSLVGLLRMGAQKIRGSILVNLIPNT